MNSKKIVLIIIGVLVLIGGVAVGVFLVSKNQDIREKAAPATTVYIQPSTQNKNPSDTFTLSVNMDTGVNQITGVDIRLNYNQNLIEVTSIQKGSGISVFDGTISNTFDNTTGKILYAVYTANRANAITGLGIEVLTVNGNIKSTASGNATLSFDPATLIYGVDESQNVIIGMTPGSIVIAGAAGQPTATPTPTPTATSANGLGGGSLPTPTPTPVPLQTTSGQATQPPLPVSGASLPSIIGIAVGVFAVIGSLLFAL